MKATKRHFIMKAKFQSEKAMMLRKRCLYNTAAETEIISSSLDLEMSNIVENVHSLYM